MIHTFTTDETRWLSNMHLVDIEFDGRIFPSVEHAYQSAKFHDESWKEYCSARHIASKLVKVASRSEDFVLRPDWDEVKLNVMEECLREKFKQEPFRSKLIATGKQNIQEGNFWGDIFWGVDLKKDPNVGENHLGRLIMKIRDEL